LQTIRYQDYTVPQTRLRACMSKGQVHIWYYTKSKFHGVKTGQKMLSVWQCIKTSHHAFTIMSSTICSQALV